MPRVTHVKAARKDVPDTDIKAGESYYWWKFRYGPKRTSKTMPKQSQLTQSEFWGTVYAMQEREQVDFDMLSDELDQMKSELEELRDSQQEKLDNMPEGLQQGSTGEMLQNRYDSLDSAVSELDGIDIPDEDTIVEEVKDEHDEDDWKALSEERQKELIAERKTEKADELWSEITAALENISD